MEEKQPTAGMARLRDNRQVLVGGIWGAAFASPLVIILKYVLNLRYGLDLPEDVLQAAESIISILVTGIVMVVAQLLTSREPRTNRNGAAVLLALFLPSLVLPAAAQSRTYVTEGGSLTVSAREISYEMGSRSGTYPNALISEALPRRGADQFVMDDIALLVDKLSLEGVEVEVPADTLEQVVDSLVILVTDLIAEADAKADEITTLQAQVAGLEAELSDVIAQRDEAQAALAPVTAERDALRAENAAATVRLRDLNRALRER